MDTFISLSVADFVNHVLVFLIKLCLYLYLICAAVFPHLQAAGIAIRPHLSDLVCCMLESLSSLEDQGLNYVEVSKILFSFQLFSTLEKCPYFIVSLLKIGGIFCLISVHFFLTLSS